MYIGVVQAYSMSDRNDLNVSRRLRRMLKASGLPSVGAAHELRMRFVDMTHAMLVLQGQCTHHAIVRAMRQLLEGWAATEEEHAQPGGYQDSLVAAIDECRAFIRAL
jgi:hypothetical protein